MRFRVSVYGARARKGKLEGALIKRLRNLGQDTGFTRTIVRSRSQQIACNRSAL